jgi:hypothetical protein
MYSHNAQRTAILKHSLLLYPLFTSHHTSSQTGTEIPTHIICRADTFTQTLHLKPSIPIITVTFIIFAGRISHPFHHPYHLSPNNQHVLPIRFTHANLRPLSRPLRPLHNPHHHLPLLTPPYPNLPLQNCSERFRSHSAEYCGAVGTDVAEDATRGRCRRRRGVFWICGVCGKGSAC